MSATTQPPEQHKHDDSELAEFGYKPELKRHARELPHFRRGYQLHIDPDRHLPALLLRFRERRSRLLVVLADGVRGQFMVALCFAELAARYPVAGSVYNWSKKLGNPHSAGSPAG